MSTAQKIIDDATQLPVEERVVVVDSLLRSLNQTLPEIDRQWAETARARLREIRANTVTPIAGQDVFDRIQTRFNR